MDDLPDIFARDFGYRPQGKSAPMAASKGTTGGGGGGTTPSMNFGVGGSDADIRSSSSSSSNRGKSTWNSTPIGNSFLDDQGAIFGSSSSANQKSTAGGYKDVFGGGPKYAGVSTPPSASSFDYDLLKDLGAKSSSSPKYDKPVYDDDIFDGVPGLKSSSSSVQYDDVFSSISSPPKNTTNYDDLLGNFGTREPELNTAPSKADNDVSNFDDLLPGFGGSSPKNRATSETSRPQKSTVPSTKPASSVIEDPFVVLETPSIPAYASSGLFTEPSEQTDKPSKSGNTKSDASSIRGGMFGDMDPLSGLAKFTADMNNRAKDGNHSKTGVNMTFAQNSVTEEPTGKTFTEVNENVSRRKAPVEDYHDSRQTLFDIPTVSSDSDKVFTRNGSHSYVNASPETNSQMSPKFEDNSEAADDIWLTVSEIPLFTQPTNAPPPSRPPPSRPPQASKTFKGSFSAVNSRKVNESSSFQNFSQTSRRPEAVPDSAKSSGISSMDELEDFAMGRRRSNAAEHGDALSSEEDVETNSAAAASAAAKEAMDKAEVKMKQAREGSYAKVVKNKGAQQEKDELDAQERELREREQREREEREREQRKLEKERERAREIERERNKHAMERATREARERAAAGARLKAEKAAVEKARAETLVRNERAAVQRANAEARERAAAEARERAERAAAEAKERSNAENREKAAELRRRAERAAVDRAAAEARERAAERAATERAAAETRGKAAAAAAAAAAAGRGSQQKNENDLESFFGMGARPNSAPKSRTHTPDSTPSPQFRNKAGPEGPQWSSTGSSSSMRKASSTTNIVDDLSSIFGAMPSSGDFQDIEGETEERRKARLERHQRTQERAKKALAEKNERDLQNQRDQAERHRIAETLDAEIKRWAMGKEGNLRALLSTLQYVLWPECGWQAVSLTDLITGASVKKVYRKATLCIHPDKVQQKGANLQQKYIAEKVFDLLKEAWNKFNSEELF